jgi:ribosome maturation factor RimP
MAMQAGDERLWQLLEVYLAAEDVELDDLEVADKGRGRVVRVTVDADGGIGVDRIAELSRGLSRVLDEADPYEDSYRLEVSSPGLERTLRRPAQYQKSVGREVTVKTAQPIDGEQVHRGVLDEVDDRGFVLQLNEGLRRIGFDQVRSARTVFTWERGAKPGKRP